MVHLSITVRKLGRGAGGDWVAWCAGGLGIGGVVMMVVGLGRTAAYTDW